jgi:hypothetical protein
MLYDEDHEVQLRAAGAIIGEGLALRVHPRPRSCQVLLAIPEISSIGQGEDIAARAASTTDS